MKKVGSEAEYKLHQWANDWITADGPHGPEVISPSQVILTEDEMKLIQEPTGSVGIFWDLYELDKSRGRLVKRKQRTKYSLEFE